MPGLRQVLQHLSNAEIEPVVRQIERKFKYLVPTEHVPLGTALTPNLDKPTGRDVRIHRGSGIVLTAAPFNLRAKAEQVLCEAPEDSPIAFVDTPNRLREYLDL